MIEESKKRWIDGYDREAKVYDAKRSFYEVGYGGLRERKMLSLFCRGPKVLNVACGSGRLLSFLSEKGFEVVGIDFSKGMLNVAKKKTVGCRNLDLLIADAEFLPFRKDAFDEIVCSRAFKFFPSPLSALNEGSRVLRKSGKIILTLETSEPLWIRVGYKLRIPQMGSRFEWRYRVKDIHYLFEKAHFRTIFIGCVIYFGKTIYQSAINYFQPSLKFLELIDSHSKIGRNIMFVGIKLETP